MSHAALRDLTEAVHGLAPRPSHADDCPACAGRMERLEGELDLLRRAEARVAPPAASSRGWRRVPVAAAAALLLAVLAFVVGRPTPSVDVPGAQQDLVSRFLDGTPEESEHARAELLGKGAAALAQVVDARRKRPDAKRADALAALAFELKRREAGERGKAAFATLDGAKITLDMQNAPITAVSDYLGEVLSLSLVLHPREDVQVVALKLAETSARQALDMLGRQTDEEYAFRWGRIYFAPAEKLWGPKALPLANRWRAQEPGPESRAAVRTLETTKTDLAFENTDIAEIVDFLRGLSKLNIVLEKGFEAPPVTLKVKEAPLGEVLELITLPHGFDARLEEGAIVLYRRK